MRFYFSPVSVLVLVVLAITNPTTSDYAGWVKQQLTRSQANDPLVGLLASLATEPLVQSTTERKSFFVFSIYTTRLDNKNQTTTLGFARNFIPLPQPESAWRTGAPSPTFPHVVAMANANQWKPEDGYVWVRPPPNAGDFRVRWEPGKLSKNHPHLVAAKAEGRWVPENGYAWNIDPPPVGQLGVHWDAGRPSAKFQHVVAASEEGHWLPAVGYKWLTNPPPPGDLRVISSVSTIASDEPTLSPNRRRAQCSISMGELSCPGPGAGLCWARGHNPYFDEPPLALDVGNPGSSLSGRSELCSGDH